MVMIVMMMKVVIMKLRLVDDIIPDCAAAVGDVDAEAADAA